MILATARFDLRELEPSDLPFIATMLADPDVMRFWPRPYTRQEAADWIDRQRARYRRDGQGLWLVVDRASAAPRGTVGLLWQEVDGVREPEVAFIVHRPFWGLGVATEAARGVRDHAFTTLGLPHVVSLIRPDNAPARAVAHHLGMEEAGTTTHAGTPHLVYRVPAAVRRATEAS